MITFKTECQRITDTLRSLLPKPWRLESFAYRIEASLGDWKVQVTPPSRMEGRQDMLDSGRMTRDSLRLPTVIYRQRPAESVEEVEAGLTLFDGSVQQLGAYLIRSVRDSLADRVRRALPEGWMVEDGVERGVHLTLTRSDGERYQLAVSHETGPATLENRLLVHVANALEPRAARSNAHAVIWRPGVNALETHLLRSCVVVDGPVSVIGEVIDVQDVFF